MRERWSAAVLKRSVRKVYRVPTKSLVCEFSAPPQDDTLDSEPWQHHLIERFKFHPVAAGPFVYHCHVLGHEDAGMMQNICVYPSGEAASYCAQWFPGSGSHVH